MRRLFTGCLSDAAPVCCPCCCHPHHRVRGDVYPVPGQGCLMCSQSPPESLASQTLKPSAHKTALTHLLPRCVSFPWRTSALAEVWTAPRPGRFMSESTCRALRQAAAPRLHRLSPPANQLSLPSAALHRQLSTSPGTGTDALPSRAPRLTSPLASSHHRTFRRIKPLEQSHQVP
jgi:hypothetical protein